MKKLLLVLFMITHPFVYASEDEDYRAIALDAQKKMQVQIAPYRKEADAIAANSNHMLYQNEAREAEKKAQEIIVEATHAQDKTRLDHKKQTPSILIFVSFSMPKQSLEAYLRDAKKIHASVVMRGLENNSFQTTFKHVAQLIQSSGGAGVELNPIWFKRFSINKVPAVVVVPEGSTCLKENICSALTDFDVMTGDITLSSALREINHRSDLTKSITARTLAILERGAHA